MPALIMRVSLAGEQQVEVNPRSVDEFQEHVSGHCDGGVLTPPAEQLGAGAVEA
jgi:hypothetical protein